MNDIPVFGSHTESCRPVIRPSAYALVRDAEGAVAVVRTPAGYFLPGGGMEEGESPEETIRREAIEECGLKLEPCSRIGRAIEIVHSTRSGACVDKDSLFLEARVTGQVATHEHDHELMWLAPDDAFARLSHGSHRWAVSKAVGSGGSKEDSSTRSWERIADDWVSHADTNDYRNLFLMPLTLSLLGDVAGRRVLDLGCGEGGYSRELARRGAHVTGVDGSARLIAIARERALVERVEVEHLCLNASALTPLVSSSFDRVLAAMSLMDVEDYGGAVREAYRVLADGGEMLMSITHPCFSGPVARWIRDEAGGLQVFAVDRYLERTVWESFITPSFSHPYLRRHRPLEDYLGVPLRAGFSLAEFREPAAEGDALKLSPRFEKLGRIPYFLFLRWRKGAGR